MHRTEEDDSFSPGQAVYGTLLILPANNQDALHTELPLVKALKALRITRNAATPPTMHHNTAASTTQPEIIPDRLRYAEYVLVCLDAHNTHLLPLYDGPFPVISHGACFFKLQMGDRQDSVHVQCLKPFAVQQVPTESPPKRSRPGVRFNIPANPKSQMLGTVVPLNPPGRFFACPGSISKKNSASDAH